MFIFLLPFIWKCGMCAVYLYQQQRITKHQKQNIMIIISTTPKVNQTEETVKVLAAKEDSKGNELLFILTVDFGELEEMLSMLEADISYSCLIKDGKRVIELIELFLGNDYTFPLTPYREPSVTYYNGSVIPVTESLLTEEHPYGFIPVEEYERVEY